MSAIRQFRVPESDANSSAYLDVSKPEPVPASENPLQLLRDAIAQLKSPTGALPDQQQVANLLAEAREALEHANVVGTAVSRCNVHLTQAEFEQALDALDQALTTYPNDPILTARRHAVEERQRAFHSAAVVRGAIEQAEWLLEHDRTDLAAQFLKEKTAELPDQEELTVRLGELEALLPEWEQRRHAQDALTRAQTLEQLHQWQAALTVIEEALQPYPTNTSLREAAQRIRVQLTDHERHKKLARRIELIKQQIGARAWRQALTLLENTQVEFPDAGELQHMRREIIVGLRRSEVEEAISEVRKCLADGELDQAQRALQRSLNGLEGEPALEALRKELEAEKRYRDKLRNAQVLFGRGQLDQAESVLTELLDQDRPEAQALLGAVRAARQVAEEENFLDRGREKALALVQQQQYIQAIDLLRNLLSLFPDNPILERDLAGAQAGLEQAAPPAAPASQTEEVGETAACAELLPPPPRAIAAAVPSAPRRFRRVAIAATATLLLGSAGTAAWKLSRPNQPTRIPTAPPPMAATPAPVTIAADPPASEPVITPPTTVEPLPPAAASQPEAASSRESKPQTKPEPKPAGALPLRAFVPPASTPPTASQNTNLPLPPGTDPPVSIITSPAQPIVSNAAVSLPAPPPAVTPAPTPAKPASTPESKLIQAQFISRATPEYPALARQRRLAGMVRLSATIDEHGDIKNVKVLSGDVILAASARNAVMLWKYKPATLNGQPIATNTEIQILFGDRK